MKENPNRRAEKNSHPESAVSLAYRPTSAQKLRHGQQTIATPHLAQPAQPTCDPIAKEWPQKLR